jgi:CRISPR-associated protein Cas2
MLIICAYDIPDDKRRRRMFKTLNRFGRPVQRSVFECDLKPRQYAEMLEAVRAVLEPAEDRVRCYKLCAKCLQTVETYGLGEITTTPVVYVV